MIDKVQTTLVLHTALPTGVRWSRNGWYVRLHDGRWRWVCGTIELPEGNAAVAAVLAPYAAALKARDILAPD